MSTDYMQTGEMQRPRGRLRRLILPLLIALAILVALLFGVAWLPLRQAREAWSRGHDAEAIAIAEKWSALHLWPAQYHQLLAAAYLASGNTEAARPHLGAIGTLRLSVVPKDEVARRLFARERYGDFLAYDAASRESGENPDVPLYRAAALLATNHSSEAQQAFASIDRTRVDGARYEALKNAVAARAGGSSPYVFDRNGSAIAAIRGSDVIATNDDFAPLLSRAAGQLTIGSMLPQLGPNDTIETTLDPVVQKAALQALGNFRGSLVAIDPRTNEILAIASSRGKGALTNLALDHQYEPGSVVKVLTGLNAESAEGFDLDSMFPYTCKGYLEIDGRHFGDWLPAGHGVLKSIDDALAVSCNVFFADAGLRLGVDRLKRFMAAAGFDGQVDLGIFPVPLGKTVGQVFNHFETAFLAIGLEHESMNALHVAMIASMMANRGVLTTPKLLVQRRSILGDVVSTGPKQATSRLASPAAAEKVIHAMEAVATEAKGTGRRAEVAGISLAMKTGTAGERKNGLEALILAFAPVESPRIAFGVIAEDAGPAEFAGAKIAHDFLEAMQSRLK
jgi:peptidoglycan glycosyltransferase